jgi:hypothetical protein
MFVLQNAPNQSFKLDGLTVSAQYVERESANFELSLPIQEKVKKITTALQYKTDFFKATTLTQMSVLLRFQKTFPNAIAEV